MTSRVVKGVAVFCFVAVCLIVLGIYSARSRVKKLYVDKAHDEMRLLNQWLQVYHNDVGHYPDDLSKLWTGSPKDVESLKSHYCVDPWGKRYEFMSKSNSFTIKSAGPDGIFNTYDDIIFSSP